MIRASVLGAGMMAALAGAAQAGEYTLTIDPVVIDTGDFTRSGVGFSGASPGPVLRFKEGEDVTIRVTNNLSEPSSIHWHGVILPFRQDGVPGLTFEGIAAGATHTYNFPVTQSGTYWYHSHSGFQEPDGAYGAIVIEPSEREPYRYDRDYVVQFTDAHPHQGARVFRNLKAMPDYYNRQQRTLLDLVRDAKQDGLGAALSDRFAWGEMRMMPTDIEDLGGTTPLINGKSAGQNWTGLFTPGERVRLRFINSSAMTYFDIRIPGLEMTVVQADGQNVQPVKVDELRVAVAETYDVIVRPEDDRAYTIFAETMGRSAHARGTLAPRAGMAGEIPAMRDPNLLTMADMGMAHAGMDMDHGSMAGMNQAPTAGGHVMPDGVITQNAAPAAGGHMMPDGTMMQGAAPAAGGHMMPDGAMTQNAAPAAGGHMMPDGTMMPGMDHAAMGDGGMGANDPFYAPGSGLTPTAAQGGKMLSYADLKAQKPLYPDREPTREIELRLTGNLALATHPDRPGRVVAGLATGGVAISEDGGRSWETRSGGLPDEAGIAIAVAAAQPDTIYAAIRGDGIWRSEDAGRSWAFVMDRPWLAEAEHDPMALASVKLATGMGGIWIYAGTEVGLMRVPDCFCRWQDVQPGDAMEALASGAKVASEAPLPAGEPIHALVSAPSAPETLYAALPSGVWASHDAGVAWSRVRAAPATAVTVHPTDAEHIVAVTDGGLMQSRDGGATWTALAAE